MRLRSVVAFEFRRYHSRQQLTLKPAEGRLAIHDGKILLHACAHDAGIHAHDADDVPDAPGPPYGLVVLLLECTGRLFQRYLVDPRHITRLVSSD